MGITKNKQTSEQISKMVEAAFLNKEILNYKELTDGMCNVAYYINFKDGSKSILKISAADNSGFMSQEVNLMYAEVETMRILKKHNIPYIAEVQFYDSSRTICTGEYFFMEVIEGENLNTYREKISEDEYAKIRFQIGEFQRSLLNISNETFGLFGDLDNKFDNFFDFMLHLISNLIEDAEKKDVDLCVEKSKILELLSKDKEYFEEVTVPNLVHFDMWEGNCFVRDGKLNGVIDWERTLWGDYLMEDRFRRHTRNINFLKGFGITEFTTKQYRRILWYDIVLYIIMMTEGEYRGYGDDSQYQWCKPFFLESWNELNKNLC